MPHDAEGPRARIEVARAEVPDLADVSSILDGASWWLASRGIDQWRPGILSGRARDRVERGEMFLARLDGEPFGTFALRWSDAEAWDGIAGEAGYVHLLAVRRDLAGRGLGRELLRRAEGLAAAAGKENLRLDCPAGNRALNAYYERAGFGFRGRTRAWGFEVSLYEKKVGAAVPGQTVLRRRRPGRGRPV